MYVQAIRVCKRINKRICIIFVLAYVVSKSGRDRHFTSLILHLCAISSTGKWYAVVVGEFFPKNMHVSFKALLTSREQFSASDDSVIMKRAYRVSMNIVAFSGAVVYFAKIAFDSSKIKISFLKDNFIPCRVFCKWNKISIAKNYMRHKIGRFGDVFDIYRLDVVFTAYAYLHLAVHVTGQIRPAICPPKSFVPPSTARIFSWHRILFFKEVCSAQLSGHGFLQQAIDGFFLH